jgi:zinc transport system ATP-binding protein
VSYRSLSQGQKQRVLFARMLAVDPEVAVLDEPTAAMDALAERDAMERLHALSRERQVAVVIVIHDLLLASRYADDILFLDRDQRVVVTGETAATLAHPLLRQRFGHVE